MPKVGDPTICMTDMQTLQKTSYSSSHLILSAILQYQMLSLVHLLYNQGYQGYWSLEKLQTCSRSPDQSVIEDF